MSETLMARTDVCVVIPVYNNPLTVADVVGRALALHPCVMVVDDGSTDSTPAALRSLSGIILITHRRNLGKGAAIMSALGEARRRGFKAIVTLDADGQHRPEDLPALLDEHDRHPHAIIIGSRRLKGQPMSSGSRVANAISNFWFAIHTWHRLPDTQTGFRLYPLSSLHGLRFVSPRYEAELELLVMAAWHGEELCPVGINVYYPPRGERVSHFRPVADFMRISLLNTLLCGLALIYGYPRMLANKIYGIWKG